MSDELFQAKEKFKNINKKLKESDRSIFYEWVKDQIEDYNTNNSCELDESKAVGKGDILLSCIKTTLKKIVPFDAILKSESIQFPTIGQDSNLDEKNCIHVDAFLYDENDVDELCDNKKLATHRCLSCESVCIEPITYITHSASKERLSFMFNKVLGNLENKILLDVGSRTGVVLYAAYAYSNAKEIIGVELNKEWCNIQNNIIDRFKLQDRINIIHGDILSNESIVRKAGVIVLHNVFEWFMSIDKQKELWEYLYENIQYGTIIAASPPIEESLELLNTDIRIDNWVKLIAVDYKQQTSEETEMQFYTVIKK